MTCRVEREVVAEYAEMVMRVKVKVVGGALFDVDVSGDCGLWVVRVWDSRNRLVFEKEIVRHFDSKSRVECAEILAAETVSFARAEDWDQE